MRNTAIIPLQHMMCHALVGYNYSIHIKNGNKSDNTCLSGSDLGFFEWISETKSYKAASGILLRALHVEKIFIVDFGI